MHRFPGQKLVHRYIQIQIHTHTHIYIHIQCITLHKLSLRALPCLTLPRLTLPYHTIHPSIHTCIHAYMHTSIHTYITSHHIPSHHATLHYITLHYITYITFPYIRLHYIQPNLLGTLSVVLHHLPDATEHGGPSPPHWLEPRPAQPQREIFAQKTHRQVNQQKNNHQTHPAAWTSRNT